MSEYEPRFLHIDSAVKVASADDKAAHDKTAKAAAIMDRAVKAPNLTCFIEQFPLAMVAIANVHDYARGPLLKRDYKPSLLRHLFRVGNHVDHDAAVVWNAMAQLEIKLRSNKREKS